MRKFKNSKGFTALRSEAEHVKMRWWAQPLAEKPQGVERKRDGFTLVELLVVIAIIGILSSVILVSLQNTRAKSRDARRISDMKSLQNAIELYRDANKGKAPATLAALAPTYIASIPDDPFTSTAYNYSVSTETDRTASARYRIQFETETSTALGGAGKYCATSVDIHVSIGGLTVDCNTTTDAK